MQRTGPILYLISVQLSDALKVILMKSVLFLFKKLVFDSFFLEKIDLHVSFYNNIGCSLNFLEYVLKGVDFFPQIIVLKFFKVVQAQLEN